MQKVLIKSFHLFCINSGSCSNIPPRRDLLHSLEVADFHSIARSSSPEGQDSESLKLASEAPSQGISRLPLQAWLPNFYAVFGANEMEMKYKLFHINFVFPTASPGAVRGVLYSWNSALCCGGSDGSVIEETVWRVCWMGCFNQMMGKLRRRRTMTTGTRVNNDFMQYGK